MKTPAVASACFLALAVSWSTADVKDRFLKERVRRADVVARGELRNVRVKYFSIAVCPQGESPSSITYYSVGTLYVHDYLKSSVADTTLQVAYRSTPTAGSFYAQVDFGNLEGRRGIWCLVQPNTFYLNRYYNLSAPDMILSVNMQSAVESAVVMEAAEGH